jgi:hypothetical protein
MIGFATAACFAGHSSAISVRMKYFNCWVPCLKHGLLVLQAHPVLASKRDGKMIWTSTFPNAF